MAVVGAIVGAGAAAVVGASVAVIVGAAVVGAVIFDYASDLLTPSIPGTPITPVTPDFGKNSVASGILTNKAANDEPIPIIYGQRKVGGTRVLLEVTGTDNEFLHMVLSISEGEINSFENINNFNADIITHNRHFRADTNRD